MKNISLLLLCVCLFSACEKERISAKGYQPNFVVEGWIEEGAYPYVMLTHNLPFFTSVDSAQLSEVVIRWAKVSVSDGENTEILTLVKDKRYFPPYGYRGNNLKGEAGKTYHLKIEYGGHVLTSETTIPPKKTSIDSIWFSAKEEGQKQQLHMKFTDDAAAVNYYRILTRTAKDEIFYPSLVSTQSDKYVNGKQLNLQINRGPVNNLTIQNEPYFDTGDTVYVKLAAIPKSGFDFWTSFNDEVLNASNPLIGSTGKIIYNIKGQGIGIWCGYNSSIYQAIAK